MRLSTAFQIIRQIHNWPEVLSYKLLGGRRRLSLLSTRSGVEVLLRRGTLDWDVFRELFLRNAYGRSLEYVLTLPEGSVVLDLGGNIGCFSLRAASLNAGIHIHSYEPGPPNLRMFQLNLLANPSLSTRIELHPEAVAGIATEAQWSFDDTNAGGSSLYDQKAEVTHSIAVQAFSDVIRALPEPIGLVKIDIEGAEYDLLRNTPADVWLRVPAFTIELHEDPECQTTREAARNRFVELGYKVEPDDAFAIFCRRT